MTWRIHEFTLLFAGILLSGHCLAAGGLGNDIAVQLSAVVQKIPTQVTLNWPDTQRTGVTYTNYTIYRKAPTDTAWGAALATLPGTAITYIDSNVRVGVAYEYQIIRNGLDNSKNLATPFKGYGYVLSGIAVPPVESRGKMILLVDNTIAEALSPELTTFQQDLIGDGWTVLRHEVHRGAEVTLTGDPEVVKIKHIIETDYLADPAHVRGLCLFGHIPVPYSGDITPDGHPDHQGAWPADMYYSDMSGTWTDTTVNHLNPSRPCNQNTPGDGKFDPSVVPDDGQVVLQTGRIDFYNLPQFVTSARKDEVALLRQYLHKDHNYRFNLAPFTTLRRRAVYADNMPNPFQRNYAIAFCNADALFGPAALDRGAWRKAAVFDPNGSYTWAFGMGGGSFDTLFGVINTTQIANTDLQIVFSVLEGSYMGDWNTCNNVVRAMLGSRSYSLASCYGTPIWHYHRMALGGTIGESAQLTQNARLSGPYPNPANTPFSDKCLAGVQTALMGDPALRLFPITPPAGLTASATTNTVTLKWTASPDVDADGGYDIYRATSSSGPFTRITKKLLHDTSYVDTEITGGPFYYLVRAIKLETSGSGTYYNSSQGIDAHP